MTIVLKSLESKKDELQSRVYPIFFPLMNDKLLCVIDVSRVTYEEFEEYLRKGGKDPWSVRLSLCSKEIV